MGRILGQKGCHLIAACKDHCYCGNNGPLGEKRGCAGALSKRLEAGVQGETGGDYGNGEKRKVWGLKPVEGRKGKLRMTSSCAPGFILLHTTVPFPCDEELGVEVQGPTHTDMRWHPVSGLIVIAFSAAGSEMQIYACSCPL